MTGLVASEMAEVMVGVARDSLLHIARAVSLLRTVYILHPDSCRAQHQDLRQCPFSLALDNGIQLADGWADLQDVPVVIGINDDTNRVVPLDVVERKADS